MTAYYNENDKHAASWLRELIAGGHIAYGVVDERDIRDVLPSELARFTQCHFFAGIGVWSHAMRLAGWPDDRPVWTGSCPCQPFSAAGKGTGFDDERHLWPAWHHLIKERRPSIVFGEQVASKDSDPWIDLVHTDLEALGYAFGAIPFPSAGVGAPHIRDRIYWVGHAPSTGPQGGEPAGQRLDPQRAAAERASEVGGLSDTDQQFGRQRGALDGGRHTGSDAAARAGLGGSGLSCGPGPSNGFWRDVDWLGCRDGKWRPVEPGTFPLAHGASARVVRLRGYGNAINAQAAKAFIESVM